MANELLYGSGSAANLFDAARTEALFEETIGDKDYSILAHPALMYFGDKAGGISAVSNIPVVDLSDDEFASLTEIEELTPSDITSAVATITAASSATWATSPRRWTVPEPWTRSRWPTA